MEICGAYITLGWIPTRVDRRCFVTLRGALDLPSVCLVSGLWLLSLLQIAGTYTSPAEEAFVRMATSRFQTASRPELIEIWHTDCHRRCRWQLIRHVEIACQFDPYVQSKRRKRSPMKLAPSREHEQKVKKIAVLRNMTTPNDSDPQTTSPQSDTGRPPIPQNPFLPKRKATGFLTSHGGRPGGGKRGLRRKKRGIMTECCFEKPCAWEEFAEYCHDNNRRLSERDNQCT
ncbi:uncharacterized protein LOC101847921 [Aplysia californica]|uniref:Uncharacterized protein LOC101847921 n=1 Tax=Aplysia californica TaxID=6500 RepID=A0ABM0JBS6_APLCA|nr:uncharacterized protein LOC101847921 [Aplysia californica]